MSCDFKSFSISIHPFVKVRHPFVLYKYSNKSKKNLRKKKYTEIETKYDTNPCPVT